MGIDARMLARVPRQVPDDEVKRLQITLGRCFAGNGLWMSRGDGHNAARTERLIGDSYDSRPMHCIERVSAYEQDGDTIHPTPGRDAAGGTPVRSLLRRGLRARPPAEHPEHRRGAGVLLPDCEVWYGGDSSGVCAAPLGPERRAALFRHFVVNAHEPYQGNFDRHMTTRDWYTPQTCAFCHSQPMRRYGWGQTYASARCESCGHTIATHDCGKTWAEEKTR